MDSFYRQQEPRDSASEYNARTRHINQLIYRQAKMAPVVVIACTNSGDPTKLAGTVDVQKLLLQVDPTGAVVEGTDGIIYKVPYWRFQVGNFAIIADPVPGDKGTCLFADQDISSVVAARGTAPVATPRRNSMNDGMFLLGFLNDVVATQYIIPSQTGPLEIVSPNGILMNKVLIDASGNITTPADVVAGAAAISLVNHKHLGVETGTDETGPPTMT